jgi:predicted amidophosphoribosyltransferase
MTEKTGSISTAEFIAKEIMRAYHAGDGLQDMAAIVDKALRAERERAWKQAYDLANEVAGTYDKILKEGPTSSFTMGKYQGALAVRHAITDKLAENQDSVERFNEWERDNPPKQTDLDALKKRLEDK